jgi:protein gp37
MSDLFHPAVPSTFIDKVFATMAMADRHVFQVLTKRPERMAKYMDAGKELWAERWPEAAETIADGDEAPTMPLMDFPPGNVWLGTSVEDDAVMDRAGALRETTAAVRFLSLEPLLGSLPDINLKGIHWVIVGGESGPGARPIKQKWVVDIRDQCRAQDVPFFFKQWGGVRKKENGRELEGRTWDEFPDEARETFAAK